MLKSKVIHIDGVFLGTAIEGANEQAIRFYAAHESVKALHNTYMPDLLALYCQVKLLFKRSQKFLAPV
ncbi:hypothetical protein [Swingsia samuiensis]|uniref:Uncharacterized protein n=1 Tax=Swingsia samuiensis TaxID=1293412 RepID=A0A4Y6UM64_9PROT|nr:hypothetical protein [Swingsia samuiensis]QDH17115.1 hypothetical protein E3D00_05700 [Swingsia samuiensis]